MSKYMLFHIFIVAENREHSTLICFDIFWNLGNESLEDFYDIAARPRASHTSEFEQHFYCYENREHLARISHFLKFR